MAKSYSLKIHMQQGLFPGQAGVKVTENWMQVDGTSVHHLEFYSSWISETGYRSEFVITECGEDFSAKEYIKDFVEERTSASVLNIN
jgi:hypothetical protein